MKYTILLCALLSTMSNAASFTDSARVVKYDPVYKTIQVPHEECRMVSVPVEVRYPTNSIRTVQVASPGERLLGTAIGAAIGNQFGKGDGRKAATVVGGLLGYGAASRTTQVSTSYSTVKEYREIEQCNTVYSEKITQDGWLVMYDYNGMIGTVHTYDTPSSMIPITISIDGK